MRKTALIAGLKRRSSRLVRLREVKGPQQAHSINVVALKKSDDCPLIKILSVRSARSSSYMAL
jgi:hypothetical protein